MYRYLMLGGVILLTACAVHDKTYYQNHPKELKEAINQCEKSSTVRSDCAQLNELAQEMTKLAYELQNNPQAFGNKISDLQVQLANKQTKADGSALSTDNPEITQLKQQLAARLAIVKWLESPES